MIIHVTIPRASPTTSFSPLSLSGDNLLTAVAVARTCDMIDQKHRTILIKSVNSQQHPSLSYHVLGTEEINPKLWNINESTLEGVCVSDSDMGNGSHGDKLPIFDATDQRECFHLAVDGHTFAVIKEHHKQLFDRVRNNTIFGILIVTISVL